jgi:hypothetical protein
MDANTDLFSLKLFSDFLPTSRLVQEINPEALEEQPAGGEARVPVKFEKW